MTDYKTETVFVSGSLSVTELREFAKAHVRSIATSRINVLIGDAYGADKLIQQELKNVYDYPFVTVYASNGKARNNIGNYKVKAIDVPTGMPVFTVLSYFQSRYGAFRCFVKRHKRRYFRAGVKNNGRRTVRIYSLVHLHSSAIRAYTVSSSVIISAILSDNLSF